MTAIGCILKFITWLGFTYVLFCSDLLRSSFGMDPGTIALICSLLSGDKRRDRCDEALPIDEANIPG